MASGDTLLIFHPYNNEPPSSGYATIDTRNGHVVLDFDAAAVEAAVFSSVMPRTYAGSGFLVYLHLSYSTATSGDTVWRISFERVGIENQDVDSDGFDTAKTVTSPAPSTSGHVVRQVLAFTNAQVDSIAAAEKFRIKIERVGSDGSDTATGDAELHAVELRENF